MDASQRLLSGHVALVTGGSRNIGRAIALALARDGADVAIGWNHSREGAADAQVQVERFGVSSCCVQADLESPDQVGAAVDATMAALGPVSIAVHNAAIRPRQRLEDITAEDWNRVLSVNVQSAFTIAQRVVPSMVERGFGRIIVLGGLHGYIGQATGVHVGASKMAVVGLARSLALEVAGTGVTVNVVVPGTIDTERGGSPLLARDPARRLAAIPVGRLGKPEDVAEMCAFLASERASYLTGQEFFVTGGTFPLVSH